MKGSAFTTRTCHRADANDGHSRGNLVGSPVCFIVHPGPRGDRGPSSLDWAIMGDAERWGVTVLQANAEIDSPATYGPAWISRCPAARRALCTAPKSQTPP